jgi:hypothetical protein
MRRRSCAGRQQGWEWLARAGAASGGAVGGSGGYRAQVAQRKRERVKGESLALFVFSDGVIRFNCGDVSTRFVGNWKNIDF